MAIFTDTGNRADERSSPSTQRADPLLNHNFLVSLLDTGSRPGIALAINAMNALDEPAVGGFSECSGLEMTMKTEDYQEGGNNGATLRFANRVEWSAITLKKGVGLSGMLWDWHYGFVTGVGRRRDGLIVLLDEQRRPSIVWLFRRGLPTRYSGPNLNATENSVAIESIEISHEGIYQVPGSGGMAAVTGQAMRQSGALGAVTGF